MRIPTVSDAWTNPTVKLKNFIVIYWNQNILDDIEHARLQNVKITYSSRLWKTKNYS